MPVPYRGISNLRWLWWRDRFNNLPDANNASHPAIVVDDGYDLFLTLMLYPNFGWEEPAYFLENDPEGRIFSEILVDVVAAEVIEPWGGGKWHMEIFRSVNPEPEDWNGEM